MDNNQQQEEQQENIALEQTDEKQAKKPEKKQKKQSKFAERAKGLWKYFTTYEKIWFFTILTLAILFAFLFPETDEPTYTVTLDNGAFNSVQYMDGDVVALDFSGTVGEYVIVGVDVTQKGGKTQSYSMVQLAGYGEHTVDPENPDSLALKLATYDKKSKQYTAIPIYEDTEIAFECYFDGDDEETSKLVVSVVNTSSGEVLYAPTAVILDMDVNTDGILYKLKENSFLVAVGWITVLYVLDVILNVACELLISKQSKWNFIVSLGVEIVEILVCIFCLYRFATMAVTLLFWIPCDIISFVMWHRHPDKQKEELTVVKKLTWWQDIIIVAAIAVWTVGVGYLLTLLEVDGGIFATNVTLKNVVCYIDACASAVGIANGVLILLRYREQWIAWYIVAILETVINIMAGQWILLVLKVGYLTNTTYGYIMWTRYIKNHKKATALTQNGAELTQNSN